MPSFSTAASQPVDFQEQIDHLLTDQTVDGNQSIDRAWELLVALADKHGIPVTVGRKTVTRTAKNLTSWVGMSLLPLLKGTRGLELFGKSIALESGPVDAFKAAVLSHELAHILLDHQHRDYLSTDFMESEADVTAYLVTRHLGVDRQAIMKPRLLMYYPRSVDSAGKTISMIIGQLDELAAQ